MRVCTSMLLGALLSPRPHPPIRCCAPAADEGDDVLRRRMDALRAAEAEAQQKLESERSAALRERIADVVAADQREALMTVSQTAELPVVCLDALLPGQRLELTTEDPCLCAFLQELGLGGLFCMVSLDPRRRRLRRHGVVARVALMDVARRRDGIPVGFGAPTAVRTSLVGRTRCVLVESPESDRAWCGRWRREHDPNGDAPALGWREEPLMSLPEGFVATASADEAAEEAAGAATEPSEASEAAMEATEASEAATEAPEHTVPWTTLRVRLLHGEDDLLSTTPSAASAASSSADAASVAEAAGDLERRIHSLLAALEQWTELARDPATYDNTDVVAGLRVTHGQPGLRRDAARLLDAVLDDLGPRPEPTTHPTAFALWVAALINPHPPMGVAPELRAAVLQATCAPDRLRIVERGLRRSIANLEGVQPL